MSAIDELRLNVNNGLVLPYDFEGLISRMSVKDFCSLLSMWLNSGDPRDLFSNNPEQLIYGILDFARIQAGIRDEIVRIKSNQSARAWDAQFEIGYSQLDATRLFLPFANVPGIGSHIPRSETDYTFWRGGVPMTNGYSCVLIPGVGLQFTTVWGVSEVGHLWINSLGFGMAAKMYTYRGIQLEGVGQRDLNLRTVGRDIYGQWIDPLPSAAIQVQVFRPLLLTRGINAQTGNYHVEFSGIDVTVKFHFDIADTDSVHIMVLKES